MTGYASKAMKLADALDKSHANDGLKHAAAAELRALCDEIEQLKGQSPITHGQYVWMHVDTYHAMLDAPSSYRGKWPVSKLSAWEDKAQFVKLCAPPTSKPVGVVVDANGGVNTGSMPEHRTVAWFDSLPPVGTYLYDQIVGVQLSN